jgi:hypothetical protein
MLSPRKLISDNANDEITRLALCRATALSTEEEALTTRCECEASPRRNPTISHRVRKGLRGGEQSLDPGACFFHRGFVDVQTRVHRMLLKGHERHS